MPFLGERLKEAREKKGITQRELGVLTDLDETQVSRYETGRLTPSVKHLGALAKALDISTDYLLELTADPRPRQGDSEFNTDEIRVIETLRRDGWPGVIRMGAER